MSLLADLTKLEPIQLQWKDRDHPVIVTPADEDRLYLTVQEAIHACKAVTSSAKFTKQFQALLDYLAVWLSDHEDKIDYAYLTVRDRGLLFLPIQKGLAYDSVLSDSFTYLDLEIANNPAYDLIELSVLGLPKASDANIASFINPELPSLIYQHAN